MEIPIEQRDEVVKKYERPQPETLNREETINELKTEINRLWAMLEEERKINIGLQKQIRKLKLALKKYRHSESEVEA